MIIGNLEQIFVAPAAGDPLQPLNNACVEPDRGLEGDRYFVGRGSFSRWPGDGRAVSLIEIEAIEAVMADSGIDLSEGRSRRNLVTRGVRLLELNGRIFQIGDVILRGVRLCAPCRYLERLIGPGTFDALRGRGGLRADVLQAGTIRIGDPIELTDFTPPVKRQRRRGSR